MKAKRNLTPSQRLKAIADIMDRYAIVPFTHGIQRWTQESDLEKIYALAKAPKRK